VAKGNLVWKLTDEGQTVTLEMHIDGVPKAHIVFDAAGLSDNIHMLAAARATMTEPVTPELEVGMRLEAMGDPAWKTEGRHDFGGAMLALRHPGYGWVSFLLPPHEAQAMGKSLIDLGEELESKGESGAGGSGQS
jgi:hypothetical protein